MLDAVEKQVLATEQLRKEVVVDVIDDMTISANELVGMASVAEKLHRNSEDSGFYQALLSRASQLQKQLKALAPDV